MRKTPDKEIPVVEATRNNQSSSIVYVASNNPIPRQLGRARVPLKSIHILAVLKVSQTFKESAR